MEPNIERSLFSLRLLLANEKIGFSCATPHEIFSKNGHVSIDRGGSIICRVCTASNASLSEACVDPWQERLMLLQSHKGGSH